MKNAIIFLGAASLVVFVVLALRPVSLSKENSLELTGSVDTTYLNPTTHDLVIRIVGEGRIFYVNRATDRNLDIPELIRELSSQQVTLWYSKQWTPMDPTGSIRHITQLVIGEKLVFTEFQ